MKLAATISIYAGGPGSGCRGDNCGRPKVDFLSEKVGGQEGSNPGGTYKGSDGKLRYVKFYSDPAQAHGETLANNIYKDLGLGARGSDTFEHNGKTALANEFISGGKILGETALSKEDASKVLDGFAADVLTANWDAVGMGLDNILMKNGEAYRIDNGGSFLMRARAGRKPDSVLNKIPEAEGFFNSSVNPDYAGVARKAGYRSLNDFKDRLRDQVKKIVALEKKSGGWDNYVKQHTSGLNSSDRTKIVDMLNDRTRLLERI